MTRLAFSTLGCPSWPLARALDAASRLGYDGVELRFVEGDDALWARPELTGTGLRETLARLADAGLAVPCVDTRSFFHSPDPGARRAALEEAARTAEVAAHLGARGIRVFGDRVQPGADLAATRGFIVEALGGLRDRLRGTGVEVWLETHGDFATGAATRSLLEEAGSEGLGAVWDPANAFSEFGEEPEAGAAALGPFLRHVHLKDARRPRDGKIPWPPALPGRGDFPAARVLEWLTAAGGDPLGLVRMGEALAPRDRGAGGGPASLHPLGRERAPGAACHRANGRAGPHLRSPARRGLPEPAHDGPRGGALRGRCDPRRHGARWPGRRHLRFRPVAERVSGRAAAGARDRLAEADGVSPRRVRRHHRRPPRLIPPLPRRPSLRPRRGCGVPRTRRPGARPRRRVRALRRAPAGRQRRLSPSSGSGRTATSLSSTRPSATSPSRRT